MTKQLLLTGGTGMVGAYVMAECLREGHELVVLARRKGTLSASQRVEKILCRFEESWGTRLRRPRVFECDLNEADLGLSDEAIRWIRTHCNQILHSAASLSFLSANQSVDNEPYRTNVDGTVRVCEFCKLNGIRQFHHVSTAYVCGKRTGSVRESEANVGQLFANDYERSKTIAETLLRQACESGKLDSLTIFRPSIVIDRTGLSPVSGDRTIYGAYSMYQMLASRFGLPEHGQWFRDLGFAGTERKNIVDVDWIARAIRVIVSTPRFHNATYHLTTESGTSVADLDSAFRIATDQWLNRSTRSKKNVKRAAERKSFDQRIELDRMAAPFVQTFLPYFRDDPIFDREQIDQVVMESALEPTPAIGTEELLEMVRRWSAFAPENNGATPSPPESIPCPAANKQTDNGAGRKDDPDDIVICGYEVRLPGGVENASDFERMLWEGKSGIGSMPASRLDRSLYFDPVKGKPGKTYTELGGCVSPSPLDLACEREIETRGRFDLTHRQFAQVAAAAVQSAFGASCISELTVLDPTRAGVFVGHSGGTELGGPLAMGMLAEAATEALMQTSLAGSVDPSSLHDIKLMLVDAIRRPRPQWTQNGFPSFNAYSVASLAASLVGFRGRREVIDAACSSSLLALHHAVTAIKADRLDVALIGGATFNNVDNLALFSQSGACSSDGCYPFDRRASGLVSSEGYVAMVLVRRRVAEQLRLPVHATVVGVGIASDGKGKGLWAPRSEGQQLAIRRVSGNEASHTALDVDYLECHATSTQIGDATELQSLTALLGSASKQSEDPARKNSTPLFVGSAKSNLGHLLEAAGLVGMVKCLIAMKNGQLPSSINFEQPNDTYRWVGAPIQVVESRRPWPYRISPDTQIAGINAFGIGGLNAHAVIRRDRPGAVGKRETIHVVSPTSRMSRETEPIAIVGRGVVLPGAKNVEEFARLLQTNVSQISDPPAGRWPKRADTAGWVGVGQAGFVVENRDGRGSLPHCRGGYIQDFCFDAQSYRIPPKTVQFANPAQLMLIQAATEALTESAFTDDPMKGEWKVDRSRIGVVVSAIFGGEFSNALQVGLRLPEIQQHLASILRDRGFAESRIASEVGELREVLMERYPALLDETGGFTASTLASRLARVFDLMGGACAVDADEASSGLGILTAMEQLRGHHVDAVLCGMAHRSMDLVAFEQVYRKNQLVESGRIEDIPQDGSRIFPGEGVAVIVLQRLSDAVAAGRTVLGIIRDEAEAWSSNVSESRKRDSQESVTSGCASVPKLISQIGHLGGGQGIVRTIASTIAFEQRPENYLKHKVVETAQDGYQVRYQIAPQPMPNSMNHSFPQSTAESNELHLSQVSVKSERLGMNGHSVNSFDHYGKSSLIQIRLQSESLRSIEKDLRQLIDHPTQFVSSQVAQFSIPMDGGGANATSPRVQAALVGRNLGEISRTAKALVEGPVLLGHSSTLSKDCGWLRICEPTDGKNRAGDRIAWLFPGQGAQYSEVPKLLSESVDSACVERAEAFLQDIDSRLTKRGIEPVGPRMSDPAGQLGRDVWWTQLWVLAMGAAMTDSLRYRGYHPDVVLGHSFGECTAAWAAGVMDIDQAIEFAKCRSDAVIMTRQSDGQLLSVRGEPSAVQSVIGQHQLKVVISHHNSPMNTVVAGSREEIARAKSCFADARLAAVVINVPAAFHTPEMQPAQDLLRARFGGQRLLPPRCSVLSAVSNRYLAEPTDLMDNLIDQLTQPVCFHGAIKRIVEEGCGLLIEVGPSEVLTRLASSAVDGRAICLSADDRIKDYRSQQKLIDLACEAFNARQDASIRMRGTQHASTDSQRNNTGNSITDKGDFDARLNGAKRFDVVDVTRQRRRSGESADRIELPLPAANGVATNPVMKSNGLEAGVRLNGDYASTGCTEKIDLHAARSFLFDLVVDLTGYDPEIVEFDADLEAELGVDSIKKAQLIGEMIQWAGMPIEPGTMQLAQFETLNDIVGMLSQYAVANCVSTGVDDVRPVAVEAVNGQPRSVASASVKIVSSKDACKHDALLEMPTRETLERLIIDIVVDQTGYDESIIDLDADMEGELGIDSIKKAQLLGELEQQYRLQSLRDSNLTLADFTTLGSIRDFVWQQIAVGDDSGAKCSADKEFAGDQRDPAALTREKKTILRLP
ncbi:type I polyketide synthase [Rhodopirellula sp. SWK7]|uniref:type I polyketide synthase n=1 Tax=Rhodopirellula sp. SWK7 TaxID=595460 RepID=UPI0007C5A030|nr:type I polyketide synthase [Rhodopirellula sp. SWK7]